MTRYPWASGVGVGALVLGCVGWWAPSPLAVVLAGAVAIGVGPAIRRDRATRKETRHG